MVICLDFCFDGPVRKFLWEKREIHLIDAENHLVLLVVPLICFDNENSLLKTLTRTSLSTIRIRNENLSDLIEARVEHRIPTSVETIKSVRFENFLRLESFSRKKKENLVFKIFHRSEIERRQSVWRKDQQSKIENKRRCGNRIKSSNKKSKAIFLSENRKFYVQTDVMSNLTFNLRLKDDELAEKNKLVLPYTKQQWVISFFFVDDLVDRAPFVQERWAIREERGFPAQRCPFREGKLLRLNLMKFTIESANKTKVSIIEFMLTMVRRRNDEVSYETLWLLVV